MAFSTTPLLNFLILGLFILTADGRTLIEKCSSGTPVCSHGQCIKRISYDEGNMVVETECICEPNYYGKACTILIQAEWDKPEIVSPVDTTYFNFAEVDEDNEDEFDI